MAYRIAAFTLIAALASATLPQIALAEPTRAQTQSYIVDKTDTTWVKRRDDLHITQIVSFPSECEMQVIHRYADEDDISRIYTDEVRIVPFGDIYKRVGRSDGISLRTKGDTISEQFFYYPGSRTHGRACSDPNQSCGGEIRMEDSLYLDVIHPAEEYNARVARAIIRMTELCSDGEELF